MKHDFRNYLLEQFGVENEFAAHICDDIRLKRRNESEPFAEITKNSKGKTVFRVGSDLHTDGPILSIR